MELIAMQEYPNRKHNRLKHYDYASNGVYFITICIKDKKCILSTITVGADIIRPYRLTLSRIGIIADQAIREIPAHYEGVSVDNYVIMPNHVHLLLWIDNHGQIISDAVDQENSGRMANVSTVIGSLKRIISKKSGISIWQKSYYDHIIRNEQDYRTRWQYINDNPAKWALDEYYKEG